MIYASYVTDDDREDLQESEDEPIDGREELQTWRMNLMRRNGLPNLLNILNESKEMIVHAYVCEGWDEQNYISADHGYYPDSRWYECNSGSSDDPCCPVSKNYLLLVIERRLLCSGMTPGLALMSPITL
jgi:hypothetical protein